MSTINDLNKIEKEIYKNYDESILWTSGVNEFNREKILELQGKNIELVCKYFEILITSDNYLVINDYGRLDQLLKWGLFTFTYYYFFSDFKFLELLFNTQNFGRTLDINPLVKKWIEVSNPTLNGDDHEFLYVLDTFHFIVHTEVIVSKADSSFDEVMDGMFKYIDDNGKAGIIFRSLIRASALVINKFGIDGEEMETKVIKPLFERFSRSFKGGVLPAGIFTHIIEEFMRYFSQNSLKRGTGKLFHYTSANALEAILETPSLKMGEVTNLNDLDEGSYLVSTPQNNVRMISFGHKPDSNDLWGNYTKFRGVQLEFDRDQLENNMSMIVSSSGTNYSIQKLYTAPMSYGEDEKRQFKKGFNTIVILLRKTFPKMITQINEGAEASRDYWRWHFKREGWRYESEQRVLLKSDLLDNVLDLSKKGYTPINYSLRDETIFIKFNKRTLKSITLSPYLKLNKIYHKGLKSWLKANGYPHVKIKFSELNIQGM